VICTRSGSSKIHTFYKRALICCALIAVTGCNLFLRLALGALDAPMIAQDGEVARLERHIVDARRAITSAEFTIDLVSDGHRGPQAMSYHVWLAPENRIRQEKRLKDDLRVSIFNDVSAFSYTRRPGAMENPDQSKRPVILVQAVDQAHRDEPPYMVIDPRNIMFAPISFSLLTHYRLESLVNSAGRSNVTLRPSIWRGLPSTIVQFDVPTTGNRYEYEAIPSLGYSIVRWRMRGTLQSKGKPGIVFDDKLEAELAQVSDSTWFPAKVQLEQVFNGKVDLSETLTIRTASVNQPIAEDVFSLKAGHLPPDVAVVELPVRGRSGASTDNENTSATTQPDRSQSVSPPMMWDGSNLRPITPQGSVEIH
jgi:hypothetical protein